MKQVNLGFYRMVLFLLLGLFTSVIAYSQQISVKGIVKDQIGEPVIGANVLVRGTTNGVITNVNGEFILSASKSDVLVVSFVGYTKYRYNNTEEVVYYLKKYQRVKEEWQADFYDAYGRHMLTFESSDEETMDALNDEDKLYSLVAEWLDFALMISPED